MLFLCCAILSFGESESSLSIKPLFAFVVCVMLSGCGFSPQQPQQQPTATITLTLTPQPNLTATKSANQAATKTMVAINVRATQTELFSPRATAVANAAITLDEIATAANGIDGIDISKAILFFGPADGQIKDALNNFVAIYNPKLSLKDFVVSIRFINPYDTATVGKWDYGVFFRNQNGNNQYRLVFFSNQSWTLRNEKPGTYIYSSNDKKLKAKVGEENTIWLIVIDKKAYLFINGIYTQSLDLGSEPIRGDVSPAAGVYYGNIIEDSIIEFRDFTVWELP
jgi:hypothetical protein